MSFQQTFNSLPPWQKGIIIIGGGVVAVVAAVKVNEAVQDYVARRKSEKTVKLSDRELDEVLKTQNLTYPLSTYQAMANQIHLYLDGCDAYTNDASVLAIIKKIRNTADWLQLVKSFGVRRVKGCAWADDYDGDLPTVLNKETSSYIVIGINNYFKSGRIPHQI